MTPSRVRARTSRRPYAKKHTMKHTGGGAIGLRTEGHRLHAKEARDEADTRAAEVSAL